MHNLSRHGRSFCRGHHFIIAICKSAKYMNDAVPSSKELQESIELANLGHIGSATLHAEAAVKTILAIFFISLSLGMFRFNRNMQNPIFQFHIHKYLDSPVVLCRLSKNRVWLNFLIFKGINHPWLIPDENQSPEKFRLFNLDGFTLALFCFGNGDC